MIVHLRVNSDRRMKYEKIFSYGVRFNLCQDDLAKDSDMSVEGFDILEDAWCYLYEQYIQD